LQLERAFDPPFSDWHSASQLQSQDFSSLMPSAGGWKSGQHKV
jgi:hypothetical protein